MIIESFGRGILDENREIDRKALSEIVFSDKEKLDLLNRIVHKIVSSKINRIIEEDKNNFYVIDVPLLFSPYFNVKYDFSIGVISSLKEKINRVILRDKMTEDEVLKRVSNQVSDDFIRANTDFIIENNDLDETFNQVKRIMNEIGNE